MSTTVSFTYMIMIILDLYAIYFTTYILHTLTSYTIHPLPVHSDSIDISHEFYSDPEGWLMGKVPNINAPLPSHLVLFDVLVPVSSLLCKF